MMRVEGKEEVELALVNVHLRRPDVEDWNVAPDIRRGIVNRARTLPNLQIFTRVNSDASKARADHVIRVRTRIRADADIAHAHVGEFVGVEGLDVGPGAWRGCGERGLGEGQAGTEKQD